MVYIHMGRRRRRRNEGGGAKRGEEQAPKKMSCFFLFLFRLVSCFLSSFLPLMCGVHTTVVVVEADMYMPFFFSLSVNKCC